MKKGSVVWLIGCLFISLLLMLPSTSLAKKQKSKITAEEQRELCNKLKAECDKLPCQEFESKCKAPFSEECKKLESDCDKRPCNEFKSKCKSQFDEECKKLKSECNKIPCKLSESKECEPPKPELNDLGNLLFKNLSLRVYYGFTNKTGTTGIFEQSSLPVEIEREQTYGIGIAYKDKSIVSDIIAFTHIIELKKYTWEKDLVFDPIKLNANVSLGRVLKTENGLLTDDLTVKTTYNVEISYCLPIETLVYYTGIPWFNK